MKKILIIDQVHPILKKELISFGINCKEKLNLSKPEFDKIIPKYQGLVLRSRFKLNSIDLEQIKHLDFILRVGSGIEHIDWEACNRLGINLMSTPEGNAPSVAQHALGSILALYKKLNTVGSSISKYAWNRGAFSGVELTNKTLAIIGYGNTGRAFSKLLKAFEVNVLAYDIYKTIDQEEGVYQVDLDTVFSEADIVSIHLPLSKETEHYIDDNFILKMQKPFYLINTSRGSHIDIESVVEGLNDGKILGACLDVLPFETDQFKLALTNQEKILYNRLMNNNVLITPHSAGLTKESYFRLSKIAAKKIQQFYTNKHTG